MHVLQLWMRVKMKILVRTMELALTVWMRWAMIVHVQTDLKVKDARKELKVWPVISNTIVLYTSSAARAEKLNIITQFKKHSRHLSFIHHKTQKPTWWCQSIWPALLKATLLPLTSGTRTEILYLTRSAPFSTSMSLYPKTEAITHVLPLTVLGMIPHKKQNWI